MAPAVPLGLPKEMLRLLVAQPVVLGPDVVDVVLDPDVGAVVVGIVVAVVAVVAVVVVVEVDDELPQAVRRIPTPTRSSAADRLRLRLTAGVTVDTRRPVGSC